MDILRDCHKIMSITIILQSTPQYRRSQDWRKTAVNGVIYNQEKMYFGGGRQSTEKRYGGGDDCISSQQAILIHAVPEYLYGEQRQLMSI